MARGERVAKEARSEFDATEASDSGGQEHASDRDREGRPGERPGVEARSVEVDPATRRQSEADRQRVPRGEPSTGGGGNASGPPTPGPSEPREK